MKPETKLFIGFSAMLLIATGGMFWYVKESKPGGLFSNDEGHPSIEDLPNMGGEDNPDDNEETPKQKRVDEFVRPESDNQDEDEDDTDEDDVPEEEDSTPDEDVDAEPDGTEQQGGGGDGGSGNGSNSPYMGVPYITPPIITPVNTNPSVTTPRKIENVSVAKQLAPNALTKALNLLGIHNTQQTTTSHVAPPRRNRSIHRSGAKRTGFRR